MIWKENKNWLIIPLYIILDFIIILAILPFSDFSNYADLIILLLILGISALPLIFLAIWALRSIFRSTFLKKDRNWLILLFYSFSIFLILYIINVFGAMGLIFWEIAFLLIIPCIISIFWCIRRLSCMKKEKRDTYKKEIITLSLVIFIGFSIFAILPAASVFPLGQQFEDKFKTKLGDDYWDSIPEKYQDRLKAPGRFFDTVDLKYFFNSEIEVKKIDYGKSEYQFFEKYDNPSIKDDDKPALIYVHGGGSLEVEPGGAGKWICTYFASIGFVAFSIEYTPTPVKPFPKGVADVMQAIVYIKEHSDKYNMDNASIALFGQSRGGHLVTLVSYVGVNNNDWWREHGANYTKAQLEVACVVDMYGAVDQYYGAEHNQFMAKRNEIIFGGTPEERETQYDEHTVKNFVSKDVPPTFIFHGSCDAIVNIGESKGLVKELEDEGADYIFLEYTFGQHGFDAVPGTPGSDLTFYFAPRFILAVLYGGGFE